MVFVVKSEPGGGVAPFQLLQHALLHGFHDLGAAALGIVEAAFVIRPDRVAVGAQPAIDLGPPLALGEGVERAAQIVGVRTHGLYLIIHILQGGLYRFLGQLHRAVLAVRQCLEQQVVINISNTRHRTLLLCR